MEPSFSRKEPVDLIPAYLSDLYPGITAYITARVTRFWDTILPNRTVATSYDLLLADEKGNAMHAIILQEDMYWFQGKIREGVVYKILRFQVNPSKPNYKVVPSDYVIYLNRSTDFEEIKEGIEKFPRYFFRLASFEEISMRKDREAILTDVAGMLLSVTEVGKIKVKSGHLVDHREIRLRLLSGDELNVSLWGVHANRLIVEELMGHQTKPVLVVVATIVKDYSGQKYLSTSSATKIYVNPDIEETNQIKERFAYDKTPVLLLGAGEGHDSQALAAAEEAIIDRLIYFRPSDIQGKKFMVQGRVMDVDIRNGWFYESCPKCSLKMDKTGDVFKCSEHGIVPPKFVTQLKLMITDGIARIVLTAFGKLADSLLGFNGTEIVFEDANKFQLPPTAKDIKNQEFIFTVGVTDQTVKRGILKYKIYGYVPKDPIPPMPTQEPAKPTVSITSEKTPAHPLIPKQDVINLTLKIAQQLDESHLDSSPGSPYISELLFDGQEFGSKKRKQCARRLNLG